MKLLVWGIGGYSHKYIENGKENYILDEYLVGGIDSNKEKQNTGLAPIKAEKPVVETKLRHLTDDEIIQGFRYLIHKDKHDK